jgi:membrane-bound ClpP family serine protease
MIRVHGELWQAVSTRPVSQGKPVRVRSVQGLKLYVEPEEEFATENK